MQHVDVFISPIIIMAIVILFSHHVFSLRLNLYKKAWEYASIGELIIIFKVVTYSIASGGYSCRK